MNYCQDGLEVYFEKGTQPYTAVQLYGYYELQPNFVNGRPYYKMGWLGLWWDGIGHWYISDNDLVGQSAGFATTDTDVFCPHQLHGSDWLVYDGSDWVYALYIEGRLRITCKCLFIQNKIF